MYALMIYHVIIAVSGYRYLHTLSGMADSLNGFFMQSRVGGLASIEVKVSVMKRCFLRLGAMYLSYVAASVALGIVSFDFFEALNVKMGVAMTSRR